MKTSLYETKKNSPSLCIAHNLFWGYWFIFFFTENLFKSPYSMIYQLSLFPREAKSSSQIIDKIVQKQHNWQKGQDEIKIVSQNMAQFNICVSIPWGTQIFLFVCITIGMEERVEKLGEKEKN